VTDWDSATAYRELRQRVTGLVRARADDLDATAPATPRWRIRDIVAHLAGICDDVAHGRLEGVGTDEWTSAQVEPRRHWPIEQLLADWQHHANAIEPMLGNFPPIVVGQMIADAVTHEQDVRGALHAPGGRDSIALAIAYDWGSDRLGERLDAQRAGTLVLDTDDGSKTVGTGDPVTRVHADRFELVRAFTGRRSRAQLQAMDRDGPLDPEALLLSTTLFSPAATDLVE
jgi:uncharacterized protein (TIGR03083 family)